MPRAQRRYASDSEHPSTAMRVYDDWYDDDASQGPVLLLLPIFIIMSAILAQFCILCAIIYLWMLDTAAENSTSAIPVGERCNVSLVVQRAESTCARNDVDINVCVLSTGLAVLATIMVWSVPYLTQRARILLPERIMTCMVILYVCEGVIVFLITCRAYYCVMHNSHGPLFFDANAVYFGQTKSQTSFDPSLTAAGDILNIGNFLVATAAGFR